jgi:Tfp pilus assembly protein PilF
LQKNPYESGLDYRVEIAQIFMRSGQEREGVIWLKGALQIDPNYPPALTALAEYYEKKGETLRAREYRERLDRRRKESAP